MLRHEIQIDESEHSCSLSSIHKTFRPRRSSSITKCYMKKTFTVKTSYELSFGYMNAHYRQSESIVSSLFHTPETIDAFNDRPNDVMSTL